MVGTRNSSIEAQIDEATRNWVTNHVNSIVGPLNEKIEGIATNLNQLMLQQQYVNKGKGNSRFSRLGKMEFPKFYGEDVKGWMFRVKQFFAIDAVGEEDKIKIVCKLKNRCKLRLALTWHMQFVKTHGEAVTWAEYEEAVLKRFRDANEDPMAELKNLRYKTTMKQYQSDFEALLNQVNITEAQAISMYIVGLPATIEMNVRMFKPRSLEDAFSLSSLHETTLALVKQRYTLILPTPRTTATSTFVNKNATYPAKNTSTLALLAPINQTVIKNNTVFGNRPRKLLSQKENKGEEEEVFEDCLGEGSNEMTEMEFLFQGKKYGDDQEISGSVEFQGLLEEYVDVFEEPKTLPPYRSFGHQIPLKDGDVNVNIRPYRYPPA
ncbi:gypsy/ty3 retroelement polyprotein [Tanacetum coccineum]